MIEWNGVEWQGRLLSHVRRPPPEGCNVRGMWLGFTGWTHRGEAIGMRLDKPLEKGKTYTYTFTYAKDGDGEFDQNSAPEFSPIVYTDKSHPSLHNAIKVGRLPGTVDWTTQSITFTATSLQSGHEWIILHGLESSGTILSKCVVDNPIENIVLGSDTTLCQGDTLLLHATDYEHYTYRWNTGAETSSISVTTPGLYALQIENYKCFSKDSIYVDFEDCEVRFQMPNIFTPNDDPYNEVFIPLEYNYIESGTLSIFNRWGDSIFSGDVFLGWDGSNASPGVYYYNVRFTDQNGLIHVKRGTVTLSKE